MVVASSPPFSSLQARTPSRANPLRINILPVSTFASKILRCVSQIQANEFKDLPAHTTDTPFQVPQNALLTPTLSRFYLQLLSIQRFCPCSAANLMIPEDGTERGTYSFGHCLTGELSPGGVYEVRTKKIKRLLLTQRHESRCNTTILSDDKATLWLGQPG